MDDTVVSDVAETVVTLDERRLVREALARLPRKHAVALVLRHSGLSYADVAAALDMSPGSVGTTVRRAESALRKELVGHPARTGRQRRGERREPGDERRTGRPSDAVRQRIPALGAALADRVRSDDHMQPTAQATGR